MHAAATLGEVRRAIQRQRPDIPKNFVFATFNGPVVEPVRRGLEDHPNSPRGRDFWPPKQLILQLPGYVEGERLDEGESQVREFKSLSAPIEHGLLAQQQAIASKGTSKVKVPTPLEILRGYLDRGYINMFLNTQGGTLFVGVEDDSWRVRSRIAGDSYVVWSEKEMDQVALMVDSVVSNMDPQPDTDLVRVLFVPIAVPGKYEWPETSQESRDEEEVRGGGQSTGELADDEGMVCFGDFEAEPLEPAGTGPAVPTPVPEEVRRPCVIQIHVQQGDAALYYMDKTTHR